MYLHAVQALRYNWLIAALHEGQLMPISPFHTISF
jgi:hypothetical protein